MTNETDIQTHVIFVGAFVQKDNKFLLARRSKNDAQAAGFWSIPGGKVDMELGDGIIEDTLKREIAEEVGITIKDKIDYLGSDGFIRVSGHHVVGLNFLTQWSSGEAQALEDQEEVAWYTLEELTNLPDLPKFLKSKVALLQNFVAGKHD